MPLVLVMSDLNALRAYRAVACKEEAFPISLNQWVCLTGDLLKARPRLRERSSLPPSAL